jgi:hypothetical protein
LSNLLEKEANWQGFSVKKKPSPVKHLTKFGQMPFLPLCCNVNSTNMLIFRHTIFAHKASPPARCKSIPSRRNNPGCLIAQDLIKGLVSQLMVATNCPDMVGDWCF